MQNIIDKIIVKLKETLAESVIREYYQGDPIAPPVANLPCIYVEADDSTVIAGATGTDEVVHTVAIGVIIDKRSEIGANANENVSHRKLLELTQDRNTNGTFKDNTIFGILRKNFTLSSTIDNQELKAVYGVREDRGTITAEARITARISELVVVSSRT